ncbi:MAG: hypothetical protein HY583_00130 [Candidatus Omnitrophica bacterium]|nr:hypothetical protein [Candidatus Omnitrophota bacterium]
MPLPESFKNKLVRLLEEEETDIYVLTMHYLNDGDLNYFNAQDRRRVKEILGILIHDTKQHAKLLKEILASE